MDVFIARQPIFDRNMKIYGYELLYRKSSENFFSPIDDDQATTELLNNAFMVLGLGDLTNGSKAFINFSKELIDSDVALLLPKDKIVVEVLERMEATQATVDACVRLKALGYKIALDDFIVTENVLPLIDSADIIKIEYSSMSLDEQRALIKKYGQTVKFLAEKIETRDEYSKAFDLGYDYFQGYFFSKPAVINAKEIIPLNINLFSVIEELNKNEPNFKVISEIIERDLGLSYKLLMLVNTIHMQAKNYIRSIPHALSYMGIKEIYHWSSIVLLKDIESNENTELIKISLVRAKLMELLASELHLPNEKSEFFFTGMFSYIDILLNKDMKSVLTGLPFADDVKKALLGYKNIHRQLLDFLNDFEAGKWDGIQGKYPINLIGADRFMELYIDSLKWADKLKY